MRGPVDEDEVAAAIHRPSLANRSSPLEKKNADKAAKAKAAERTDKTLPETDDDPYSATADGSDADEPVVIEAEPSLRTAEPVEPMADNREAADEDVPDPTKAANRAEPVEDTGANERAVTDNAKASPLDNRDITAEADPYAAFGVHAGGFLLKPSLEQGVSWTSNANGGGGAAFFSETTLRLSAESNWSRHSASLNAYGTWQQPLSGSAVAEPKAGVDAALRLDLDGPWAANAALKWALAREAADSAVAPPVGASRPLVNTLGGSLGLSKDEGKARLGATAVERNAYGDATLAGGGTLSQQERNQTLVSATLRAGYEVSPAFIPFAEVEFGRRMRDLTLDTAGYARSGTQVALRAGFAFDRDEKLDGEVAVGWLREDFDDSRLAAISGLSIEGAANWSPFRETTVTLKGSTTVEASATAGRSGSLLHAAELSAKRQLRADLSAEAGLSASLRDYSGSSDADAILAASAGFTWWMNRHLGLTGRARHEIVQSTISGNSSATTSVFLGLKLQR
ncbi:MAG: outer membrane beta-barrel protein [Phyllobacteriaceae bacterium]|nr:outer membrane beta-barrel protein [Phyllobacteriaceae bacterium]